MKYKLLFLSLLVPFSVFAADSDGITLESTNKNQSTVSGNNSPLKFDESIPAKKQDNQTEEMGAKKVPKPTDKVIKQEKIVNPKAPSTDKVFEKAVTKDKEVTPVPAATKPVSQLTPQDKVDNDYVNILVRNFVSNLNRENTAGVMEAFKVPFTLITSDQQIVAGLTQFNSSLIVSDQEVKIKNVKLEEKFTVELDSNSSVAYVYGLGEETLQYKDKNYTLPLRYTLSLSKQSDGWKISNVTFGTNFIKILTANSSVNVTNIAILSVLFGLFLGGVFASVIYRNKNK